MACHPMTNGTAQALGAAGLDPLDVVEVIRRGLTEDFADGADVTSLATVPADAVLAVRYVSRGAGVAAGLPVLAAVVEVGMGPDASLRPLVRDGDRLQQGGVLAELEGPARAVLAVERLSLNLLGRLCGVATVTRKWVDAVSGTRARVRDTRKTTPGLRSLEKYAVRCGGGASHRRGLGDAVLIKDNHVAAAGGVGAALDRVAAAYPGSPMVVQVEVDDLQQLREAVAHGATQVLLDNFTVDDTAAAVAFLREHAPGVAVESSGGLTLDRAAEFASTGVDYLAIGALTHSARVLDIGLDAAPLTRSHRRGADDITSSATS